MRGRVFLSAMLVAGTIALAWATLAPAQAALPIRIEPDSPRSVTSPEAPSLEKPTSLPSINDSTNTPTTVTAAKVAVPVAEPAPPPPASTITPPEEIAFEELVESGPDLDEISPDAAPAPQKPTFGREMIATKSATIPSASTPVVLQPILELRHDVPKSTLRKEPIPVRITVANRGSVAAERVVVSNDLGPDVEMIHGAPKPDQNVNSLIWALGTLAPGEEKVIDMTVIVKPNAQATVLKNSAAVTYQITSTQQTVVHSPKLQLTMDGPERAILGEAVTYTIEVKNVGDAPANNVLLKDPLPEGLTHPYGPDLENEVGDLAVGESRTIRLSLTPEVARTIVNKVIVSADGTDTVEAESPLAVEEIRLSVESRGPKVRYLNRPCTYEIVVSNPGSAEAKDVVLSATMPGGLGFVHASSEGIHDGAAHAVVWEIGTLKPAEEKTIALTGLANELGDQVFHASLKAANNFHKESTWTTSIQGVSALQVEVLDVNDPLEVGADGIYEIRVTNQGTVAATNVRVEVTIPAELEATAADGPTAQKLVGHNLAFEPIEKLAPKADATFRIKVRGTTAGDCRFRASVTTDQLSKPVLKEESTTVYGDEVPAP